MTVFLRPTTPDPFAAQTVVRPDLYDIATELHPTTPPGIIVIDLSDEILDAKNQDVKLALRVAQIIGSIIALLGVITCLYAYQSKLAGYTILGIGVSFLGCIISCGASCTYISLKERQRI